MDLACKCQIANNFSSLLFSLFIFLINILLYVHILRCNNLERNSNESAIIIVLFSHLIVSKSKLKVAVNHLRLLKVGCFDFDFYSLELPVERLVHNLDLIFKQDVVASVELEEELGWPLHAAVVLEMDKEISNLACFNSHSFVFLFLLAYRELLCFHFVGVFSHSSCLKHVKLNLGLAF